MRKVFAVLAVALMVIAGCGDDEPSGPRVPNLSGAWSGSAGGFTFAITLTESEGGILEGNGSASGPGFADAIEVSGRHAHPSVSLTVLPSQFDPMNFQGTLSDDRTINGTLNGSGFNNFALTLRR